VPYGEDRHENLAPPSRSGLPKLEGALREHSEHLVECGYVEVASQSGCDIAYGRVGREVVFSSQRLDFLRHDGTVFERAFGFVDIQVGQEERTNTDRQYTQEANRFVNFKAAAKTLEPPLDHRVGLIGRGQPRRVTGIR